MKESETRNLRARFAEEFASAVSTVVGGGELSVRGADYKLLPYAEFLATLHEPTCSFVLTAGSERPQDPGPIKDAPGWAWLEIAPALAHRMVDSLLGGEPRAVAATNFPGPDRPLTAVERRLLRRVAGAAGECLTKIRLGQPPLTFLPLEGASGEAMRRPSRTNEPVAVFTFACAFDNEAGPIRLCLPHCLLRAEDGTPQVGVRPAGRCGPLEVSAAAPDIRLSDEELASLAPGDILGTDSPAEGEVIVRVAGIPKYFARLGTCDGRRAVTITRRIDSEPPPEQARNEPSQ